MGCCCFCFCFCKTGPHIYILLCFYICFYLNVVHGIHTTDHSGASFVVSGGHGNNTFFQKAREMQTSSGDRRRLQAGLGSSPPRCASKCSGCTPCRPVHMAVLPGTPVTMEYYPEAWRCKCGNKLFMP